MKLESVFSKFLVFSLSLLVLISLWAVSILYLPANLIDLLTLPLNFLLLVNIAIVVILAGLKRNGLKQKLKDLRETGLRKVLRAMAAPLIIILLLELVSYFWKTVTATIGDNVSMSLAEIQTLMQIDYILGTVIALASLAMYVWVGYNTAKALQGSGLTGRFENAFAGLIGGAVVAIILNVITFISNTNFWGIPLVFFMVSTVPLTVLSLVLAIIGGFLVPRTIIVAKPAPKA